MFRCHALAARCVSKFPDAEACLPGCAVKACHPICCARADIRRSPHPTRTKVFIPQKLYHLEIQYSTNFGTPGVARRSFSRAPAKSRVPISANFGIKNRVRGKVQNPRALRVAASTTSFAWPRHPSACPIAPTAAAASCRRRNGSAPASFPASGSQCRSP
jgi:hypothetical protein